MSPVVLERVPPPETIDQVKGPPTPPEAVKVWIPLTGICLELNPMIGGGKSPQESHCAQEGLLRKNINAVGIMNKRGYVENFLSGLWKLSTGAPFKKRISSLSIRKNLIGQTLHPKKLGLSK